MDAAGPSDELEMTPTRITQGAFKVSKHCAKEVMHGIDVKTEEVFAELDNSKKELVVDTTGVLYLSLIHGLSVILAGRESLTKQSNPLLPCLPLEFMNLSNKDFLTVVV